MHEFGYVLSRQAQRDLEHIAEHVASEGGAESAVHVVEALRAAFRLLAEHPRAGHSREDLTSDPGVRFWPVLPYLVAYAPHARPLGIACIVHGSRDPEAIRLTPGRWRGSEPKRTRGEDLDQRLQDSTPCRSSSTNVPPESTVARPSDVKRRSARTASALSPEGCSRVQPIRPRAAARRASSVLLRCRNRRCGRSSAELGSR